jgi:ComF family protein
MLDGVWPPRCALCQAAGAILCPPCRADAARGLAHRCTRCALPVARDAAAALCGRCLKRLPAYDTTVAAALFEAPFDQLVRGLKYGATLAYAPLFAQMLAAERATPAFGAVDLLIPVPLSRARMSTRGFNQAIEIAAPLAKRLGRPLVRDAVLRVVDTAPQASLRIDARRRNVRGAFAVVDARRGRIAGRHVGVVDDVMTTGATLDELARTLKRAGAASVVNLVVARTL